MDSMFSQLWDLDMKDCHAKFERAEFDFTSMERKKGTLDIALDVDSDSPIAAQTCDTIVVSLIAMEKWRRYFSVHARSDY